MSDRNRSPERWASEDYSGEPDPKGHALIKCLIITCLGLVAVARWNISEK